MATEGGGKGPHHGGESIEMNMAKTVMGLTNGGGVFVKLVDNSSNRLRPKMKYAIGPLKFLINVLLFCTIAGFAYVSASDVQKAVERKPKIGISFDELKGLRGSKNSENSGVAVIENVKKFMLSLSNGMGTIQNHYNEGNMEEAGKALKAVIGDSDKVAESIKEVKRLQGFEKDLPEFLANNDERSGNHGIISLKDIPNSMLGEQIHKDLFDKIIDYTKEFTKTLEDVDLSLFEDASAKKKSTHLSSRSKSKPPPKNDKQHEFNMKNAHFDSKTFFQMNTEFTSSEARGFMKSSSVQSIHRQMKVQRKGISLPKLSSFVSVRDYETVMSKHKLRQEAMEMDEYDMAATAGSENYGKLRVGANELNLYNVDGGIGKTLQGIKKLVDDGDPNNTSQCNDVLMKFFTACDPNSESCSNANQHTFQAESNPLSYTACAEFVAGFDHLYTLRDTAEYPHQNPMLRNPNVEIDISDFKAGSSFFDQIQFPLAYNFPQDDETGVVDRSFTQDAFRGGSSATLTNRKFSLVDPETNMALSVTDCALPLVRKVKLQHDSTDPKSFNIGEVEVYDQLGNNQAKNKPASQSSDLGYHQGVFLGASLAVDGNPSTFSHTAGDEHGKLMLG
eukprot:scaffold1095_cov36-Cyclotella_meneghiniana.AAC.2